MLHLCVFQSRLILKRYLIEVKLEMAAGGPGDHPLTDVINYNMDVYAGQTHEKILI
jgi:hypothetical protein